MRRSVRLWLVFSAAGASLLGPVWSSALPRDQTGLEQFLAGVKTFAKLRDTLRAEVPPLHGKDQPEQIQKHRQFLAERIQEARKDAKAGDIFTEDAQKEFRIIMQKAFSGKHARSTSRTIAQGNPVDLHLQINQPYPEQVPVTTMPVGLLQRFPKLPKGLEYRIVGNDLILLDLESRLVIDIFRGALPDLPHS